MNMSITWQHDANEVGRYFKVHDAPRDNAISKEEYEFLASKYTGK